MHRLALQRILSKQQIKMASSVASTSTATHRGGAPSRRGRFLGEQDDEWTHNAWDDVKWDDEQLQYVPCTLSYQHKR